MSKVSYDITHHERVVMTGLTLAQATACLEMLRGALGVWQTADYSYRIVANGWLGEDGRRIDDSLT